MASPSVMAPSAAADRASNRARSRRASLAPTGRRPDVPATARSTGALANRTAPTTAMTPARNSGRVTSSARGSMPSAMPVMPAARARTEATSERCSRRGRGGRAATASVMGILATVRAGHQAASVAVMTARSAPMTGSQSGMLNRSIRWAAAGSSAGAIAIQVARPVAVPTTAATTPTATPLSTIACRSCRGVAPTAASIPSCRSRRWASVTKLAPATRHTSTMATTATANTATAAVVCSVAERASLNPGPGSAGGRKVSARSSSASTSTVIDSGEPVPGETQANSSSRSFGFSTKPTTCSSVSRSSTRSPMPTPRSEATPSVSAASPGSEGAWPERTASIGPL